MKNVGYDVCNNFVNYINIFKPSSTGKKYYTGTRYESESFLGKREKLTLKYWIENGKFSV